jgi:hypothetical protein
MPKENDRINANYELGLLPRESVRSSLKAWMNVKIVAKDLKDNADPYNPII